MKLIIGTDSLHPPLTGVGRYSYELCRRYLDEPGLEPPLGFDLGHFHDLAARISELESGAEGREPGTVARGMLALRRSLANSVFVMRVYEEYANRLSSRRLRRFAEAVFHSPNYHLPAGHTRSVVTVHDMSHVLYPQFHPRARVAWMQRTVPVAVEAAARVICVSESTRRDLLAAHSIDPAQVVVTPLGVDASYMPRSAVDTAPLLERFALRHGEYFLCVATLEPRKNIGGLLSAYLALPASLRAERPLVLVGAPGWKCEALQARIAEAAEEGVRHLGYVADADLPRLYSGAQTFVYPSYYEGFGLPVLEAQACGTPVITSDRSSLPEVVGPEAQLVDPDDVAALARALLRAAEDADWRHSCAAAGRRRAAEFSWDRCAQQTLDVYRAVARLPV